MNTNIPAIFGDIPIQYIHLVSNDELNMIQELVNDIVTIKHDNKRTIHFGLSSSFFSISATATITYFVIDSPPIWLAFVIANALILGFYQLWQYLSKRKKEITQVEQKQKKLDALIVRIKDRLDKTVTSIPKNDGDSHMKAV